MANSSRSLTQEPVLVLRHLRHLAQRPQHAPASVDAREAAEVLLHLLDHLVPVVLLGLQGGGRGVKVAASAAR